MGDEEGQRGMVRGRGVWGGGLEKEVGEGLRGNVWCWV